MCACFVLTVSNYNSECHVSAQLDVQALSAGGCALPRASVCVALEDVLLLNTGFCTEMLPYRVKYKLLRSDVNRK